MSDFLKGKTAVITGGSRGLGKAMALALAGEGVRIALAARDEAAMASVAREIADAGSEAACFKTDVSDEASVESLREAVLARFGGVEILINNAGINLRKAVHEFTLEEWRRVNDTNVTSVFLLCRAFVPQMKGRGYGRILNMTSIMSHISLPGRTAYSTSKAALLGFTRALALELAQDGVTVVGISPGPFATEMNQALIDNPELNAKFLSNIPVGRWGKVDEIGKLVRYLCSEDAGFITGSDILIDGGWCAQ
ncbi:MAG TPA: SDR family NAD(P)-dependent oxidoreductase [Bryobacteraceae bacterium]|nr:SDR family NAD(P)-dependent oxidoreductase [Bryobacteraceae bacterium]